MHVRPTIRLGLTLLLASAPVLASCGVNEAPPQSDLGPGTTAEEEFERAVEFRRQAYYDSALVCLSRALDQFYLRGDSVMIAQSLVEVARSLIGADRIAQARDSLLVLQHMLSDTDADAPIRLKLSLSRTLLLLRVGDYAQAVRVADSTTTAARRLQDTTSVLLSTCYASWALRELGRYSDAAVKIESAISSSLRSPETAETRAYCLSQLGLVYWFLGEEARAESVLNDAWQIRSAEYGSENVLTTAVGSNLANVLYRRGEYATALRLYFSDLRANKRAYGELSEGVARSYSNIGLIYWRIGSPKTAVEYLERSTEIRYRLQGDRHPQIHINFNRLGLIYSDLGDLDRALLYHRKSLAEKIRRGTTHPELAHVYNNIGLLFFRVGRYDSSRIYQNLARRLREESEVSPSDLIMSYHNLGQVEAALGQNDSALQFHRRGIELSVRDKRTRPNDWVFGNLQVAELYLEMDNVPLARNHIDAALGVLHENKNQGRDLDWFLLPELKKALGLRARIYASADDLESRLLADSLFQVLLDVSGVSQSFHWDNGAGSPMNGMNYVSSAIGNVKTILGLGGSQRYIRSAFRYSEAKRLGALREAIFRDTRIRESGVPDSLRIQLGGIYSTLQNLKQDLAAARATGLDEKATSIQQELSSALLKYDDLLRKIELDHPTYYAIKYGNDLVDAEAAAENLDDDEALVEFYLDRDYVYVIAVTKTDWHFTSTERAPVERSAGELLSALKEQDFQHYVNAAADLYAKLLAEVAPYLTGKDLIIIPDGVLHHVPFETLLVDYHAAPTAQSDYTTLPYLLKSHPISYSYSATLRAVLGRRSRSEPDRTFAGFAPVTYPARAQHDSAQSPSMKSLPGAGQEVRRLLNLFIPKYRPLKRLLDTRNLLSIGPGAREESVKQMDLQEYKYLHFATHGIVNDSIPELSGLLLHPASRTEDDVLHLGEIYSLELNADLVVLSACETGRGRLSSGEGVIGLTGGFLYAGARNVVVSQWQVDDSAAGRLMIPFYVRFLRGGNYRDALRDAKLDVIMSGGIHARPYYWAPYVLFDS